MKKHILVFALSLGVFLTMGAARFGQRQAPAVISGSVNESMFDFSDVLTANATTARHGLFPKLPTLSAADHPAIFHPVQGWKTNASIWRYLLKNPSDTSSTDEWGNILVQDPDGWFYTLTPGAEGTVLRINGSGVPSWTTVEEAFFETVDEPMFDFSDVATANASTSEHGLMPKLNGNANTFFNGNGGQTAVSEAGLSFSDNTTADATTLKHGLLPKLGGGTSNFLRADGTWAEPPGSGEGGGGDFTYMRVIHESETIDFETIDEYVPYGLNVTVTGAEVGDPVVVVANWATSNLSFHGIVTAPDTVELQVLNNTDAPINPASQNFEIYVFDQDTVDAPFGSGIETTFTATATPGAWSGTNPLSSLGNCYASVTVTGAAVGDVVTLSQPNIVGVFGTAVVTGANTVRISLFNIDSATVSTAALNALSFNLVLTRIE